MGSPCNNFCLITCKWIYCWTYLPEKPFFVKEALSYHICFNHQTLPFFSSGWRLWWLALQQSFWEHLDTGHTLRMVAQQLPKAWISDKIMELPSFWIMSHEGEVISNQVSAIYLGIFDYVFAVPDDKILQKSISLLVTKKRLPSGGGTESTSIGTAYISLSSHSAVHQLCYLRQGTQPLWAQVSSFVKWEC